LGATGLIFESFDSASALFLFFWPSCGSVFASSVFNIGAFTAVLAFEVFDLADSFEPSSFLNLPNHELLELGLSSVSSSSRTFDIRVGVAFLCWENSVSGGLGGLPSFAVVAPWGN
jgi:hypothetical protein